MIVDRLIATLPRDVKPCVIMKVKLVHLFIGVPVYRRYEIAQDLMTSARQLLRRGVGPIE